MIGSIGIALGARVSQEIIGKHGDSAMVEIVFQIEDEETKEKLSGLGVDPDEGQIVISRRITGSRSVNRINGENVPVSVIRQVVALCIDIHGQHENQSLLQKDKHLAIVDEFATKQCVALKQEIAALYREYTALKNSGRMKMCRMRSVRENLVFWNTKNGKLSASLHAGEIEEVEEAYRRASGAETIVESLSLVHRLTSDTATGAVSHALQSMRGLQAFGEEIQNLQEELLQIEGLFG